MSAADIRTSSSLHLLHKAECPSAPEVYLQHRAVARAPVSSGAGGVARGASLNASECVGVARAALLIVWELAQRVAPSILDRFAARLDSLVGRNVYYILDKNCT